MLLCCITSGVRDGPAVPRTASQAMPPPAPKPHAIASLGVGGAAAASRKAAAAAALAALEAASKAPKQLASELTGRAITVTGMNGARVYCQLAQMPAVAAATLAYGSGSGRAHAGSRGGLLQTSIDDLLDMLADRRRQVGVHACTGPHVNRNGGQTCLSLQYASMLVGLLSALRVLQS